MVVLRRRAFDTTYFGYVTRESRGAGGIFIAVPFTHQTLLYLQRNASC